MRKDEQVKEFMIQRARHINGEMEESLWPKNLH